MTLRVKADYAEYAVEIATQQKQPDAQLQELSDARKRLAEALAGNAKLQLGTGTTDIVALPQSAGGGVVSFLAGYSATARVSVLYPLAENDDLITVTREVTKIIREIPIPAGASYKYTVGGATPRVESPGQHRVQLLKLILDDVSRVKSVFSTATSISVSGLSEPIRQVRVDDTHVDLYIDYKLTVQVGESSHP